MNCNIPIMINMIPLLVAIMWVAKWKRDEKRIYKSGFNAGFKNASDEWTHNIERKVKSATQNLVEKYPLSITVEKETTYNHGKYDESYQLIKLPTLAFQIVIHPNQEGYLYQVKKDG